MKEHNIKIRELILTSDKKTFSCETFVYEPSNIEEESLGNLYIVGWVKSQKKDLEFLPNLIASIAKREFYKLSDKDPETSFENCLKKANAALLDISREHKNLRRHISFCILNTSKNKMRFSQIGEHFIYLLKNEVVLDIGSSKESKNRFSAVISGDINVGDKYIFGTSKLGDLFSKKSIGRVLDDKIEKQAETINRIYEAESKEKENKEEIILKIKTHFRDELNQEIGGFDAEFLLDFFVKEIGHYFYNQALTDVHALLGKTNGFDGRYDL